MDPIWGPQAHNLPSNNICIAANIREFMTDSWPIPAQLLRPQVDPSRFHSLDRFVTRQNWLPTILTCQAFHRTGFLSDYYLLEAEIRAKLSARPPKTLLPPKHDYSAVTPKQRYNFNNNFCCAVGKRHITTPILTQIGKSTLTVRVLQGTAQPGHPQDGVILL